MPHDNLIDPHGALIALIEPQPNLEMAAGHPAQNPNVMASNGSLISNNPGMMGNNGSVVVTTAPPPPYNHPNITTLAPLYPVSVPYASFVQGIHPHPLTYHGGALPVQLPPPPHVQMYLTPPPPFQYPPQTQNQSFNTNTQPTFNNGHYPPQNGPANIQYYSTAVTIPSSIRNPPNHMFTIAPNHMMAAQVPNIRPQNHRQPQQFSQAQLRYLLAAYRVGMLALETLARRVHDDRPQAKYARNPPYGEDVKWLLRIAKHLGKCNFFYYLLRTE